MVLNERMDTFDEQYTKCLFFGNCEGNKVYKFMYLKKIQKKFKSRDILFMEDSTNMKTIWKCVKIGGMKLPC